MAGIAGHATLVRASEAAKARQGVFHPEPAPVAALSAGLRARFDPRGILNPGRMTAAPPPEGAAQCVQRGRSRLIDKEQRLTKFRKS